MNIKPTTTKKSADVVIPKIKFDIPTFTGEPSPTIIHPDLRHLVLISGFRGTGKTSFALKMDNPNNMIVITLEAKTGVLAKQLGVGAYFSVIDEVITAMGDKFDIHGIYDYIFQIISSIPEGRFTTLFIDNASDLQEGCAQVLRQNPALAARHGVNPANAISGGFGGPWPGVKHMIKQMLHLAVSKQIKVMPVSFQMKPAWKDGKPQTGKFKTTDVSAWHEESNLTLVLKEPMPEYSPTPRALVFKEQLSTLAWDNETQTHKQIRRLPYALPKALPSEVYRYLREPADFKNPKPGETVDILEIAPFTPTFEKEQLTMLERIARVQDKLGISGEEGD